RLTVADNLGNGIVVGPRILEPGVPTEKCLIRDCVVARNCRTGISARGGVVSHCTISENADGVILFHGQIRNCVIRDSYNQGITAVNSTVADCEVLNSDEDGIEADGSCQILNNRVVGTRGSPGYALKIAGHRNRVENNSVVDNNYGVLMEGTSNIVVKNTFSGNDVDWQVTYPEKNTAPAPISPGSAITNASPWANIIH
ncbi:MAG TPA: right-handed parallel beta-helix repeat-containing protein, partial [Candidatus Sulfotelmatobacter sp.]|nr:right-handed parallel beta-helix repeat-containing protein [Candidatus Sulfotelmatobacter sp.]